MDVFDDLAAEQDRLAGLLGSLDDQQWSSSSGATGWSIADVVLHLAQTEEAAVAAVGHAGTPQMWRRSEESVDDAADAAVRSQRMAGAAVFERWQAARRASVAALRSADPSVRVPWVASTLTPATLATTRLAEHWAHGLDITDPLRLPFPDTDRLRHIAWLGHRTLPYACQVAGIEAHEVYCELTAPGGDTWRFGPESAESRISGSAGEFCRVGARRLAPEQTSLITTGPHAADALRVLRNYAA